MSSRRKPIDTSLFRTPERVDDTVEDASGRNSGDVTSHSDVRLKRASFDLREEQIHDLNELKIRLARQGQKRRMSDLAQEAVDLLLDKYR